MALLHLVRRISGCLVLVWLIPGSFFAFLGATVTMPLDGSWTTHPAFRDWALVGLSVLGVYSSTAALTINRLLDRSSTANP